MFVSAFQPFVVLLYYCQHSSISHTLLLLHFKFFYAAVLLCRFSLSLSFSPAHFYGINILSFDDTMEYLCARLCVYASACVIQLKVSHVWLISFKFLLFTDDDGNDGDDSTDNRTITYKVNTHTPISK